MADQRQYNYTLTELTRKLQRTSTVTQWFAYQAAEWSGLDDRHAPSRSKTTTNRWSRVERDRRTELRRMIGSLRDLDQED